MLIGMVEGTAVATIKHRSMRGCRLLVVQPLDAAGGPEGDPLLAVDTLGAGWGVKVLLSNDGRSARELVGDETSPLRWTIIGIPDHQDG